MTQLINPEKIFIIGLPRTSTTSVCLAMLELGFSTAHTAYTHQALAQAQVIADTPVFCDYQQLDKDYPNAKFIYLTRQADKWLPSIKQLLQRMYINLQRTDGGFNPSIKRCYNTIFSPLTEENISQDDFLLACYNQHQQGVNAYFKEREQDLLIIDVSQPDSYAALVAFVEVKSPDTRLLSFEHVNKGGKITAWNKIKHPLKIEATHGGRIDKMN